MKKMLLICLMLMTVLAVSAQERGYVCTGNNVNIRKGPGMNIPFLTVEAERTENSS